MFYGVEISRKDSFLTHPPPPISPGFSPSSPSFPSPFSNNFQKDTAPSSGGKISPAILFIIVILAVIFFISGLLHLLVRFLIKQPSSTSSQSNRYPEMSGSDALQRQLQQLFHLHDSGLDQAFIDALPVFLYKEIMGLKEPFDCAVCLCEFGEEDKLRLLPLCSHAFHINCIDTWLLSNSTCPLCRGTLFTPGITIENPMFDTDLVREEDGRVLQGDCESGFSSGEKPVEVEEVGGEKKVYHVRLGKFKSVTSGGVAPAPVESAEAETSSRNLDARRCYSMGSFQYVVAESNLQVAALPIDKEASEKLKLARGRGVGERHNVNFQTDADMDGKKLTTARKGESFSVSKIWLWSKKGNYPSSSNTHINSLNMGLPLTARTQAS
ncbi:RING-type E3 ubiquitin transferase [Ranunculus cassubicifolius]